MKYSSDKAILSNSMAISTKGSFPVISKTVLDKFLTIVALGS